MRRWDVVVAGAGPAGSLSALALARRGLRVLLAERARFPRWKVCGACLGPGALRVLEVAGLGDLPGRLGAVPLADLGVMVGGRSARIRLQGNVALSREALDAALVDSALGEGVDVAQGCTVRLLRSGPAGVLLELGSGADAETVEAGAVVDATGLASGLNDARAEVAPGARVGLGAVFADAPDDLLPGHLRMVVGQGGYVGLVRDEEDRLTVAAAVDLDLLRVEGPAAAVEKTLREGMGAAASEAVAAVCVSEPLRGWKGTPALTRQGLEPEVGGRIFRVGDAAGYVEPFTGEGMGWALGSGLSVASPVEAALAGEAEAALRWFREQRIRSRRAQRLCRGLAWGLRRPRLALGVIRLLHARPSLARPLVTAGSAAPFDLGRIPVPMAPAVTLPTPSGSPRTRSPS